jgi:hypothetical protein
MENVISNSVNETILCITEIVNDKKNIFNNFVNQIFKDIRLKSFECGKDAEMLIKYAKEKYDIKIEAVYDDSKGMFNCFFRLFLLPLQ